MLDSTKTNFLVFALGLSFPELLSIWQNYPVSLRRFLATAEEKNWKLIHRPGKSETEFYQRRNDSFSICCSSNNISVYFPQYVRFQFFWDTGVFESRTGPQQKTRYLSPLTWFYRLQTHLEGWEAI